MNKAEKLTGIELDQWEVNKPSDPDQYYDCDAIIEAYFKGKADGLLQQQKLYFKEFSSNFDNAKSHVIKTLYEVEKNGFKPLGAYLKFKSWDAFQAILLINDDDFVKEGFLKNYDFLTQFESEIKSDFYSLKFSFLCGSPNDLDENLTSDGYIIKFTAVNEATTRPA